MDLPEHIIDSLPESLREGVVRYWRDYAEAAGGAGVRMPRQADFLAVLARVWACSDFVAKACVRSPVLLADLLDSGDLLGDYAVDEYHAKLDGLLGRDIREENALARQVARFRQREMVRIAWRDLAGWADLDEVLRDLSLLAEACIEVSLARLRRWHEKQWGKPVSSRGDPVGLVVLGMGKLGARELNFSSDIDLIFAYAEEGETRGRRHVSHEEFFTRLGRSLIQALSAHTPDGFAYRVDMRLRPFGDSGPLAASFEFLEDYYQTQGRDWERYALIKARVVAGDRQAGETLMALLRPFVYRRYLDFGAFESLREMKSMIEREVRRRGLVDNIKLGPGGIREIEFIGQAFQLIRGGQDTDLQARGIRTVLERLAERGHLPAFVSRSLLDAYDFLRRTENRLQAVADEQTHALPTQPIARERLAFSMGFDDWDGFSSALQAVRNTVQQHFEGVFAAPQTEQDASGDTQGHDLTALWQGSLEPAQALALLKDMGFDSPRDSLNLLRGVRESSACQGLSAQGRARLDRLMPLLLGAVGATGQPDRVLGRVLRLIEAVMRRSAYLSLLAEHPLALSQLVRLCGASPWIAACLSRYPVLLDELLDPRTLYNPPDREGLASELSAALNRLPVDDLEAQMETLRHFRHANVLRVAAADVVGALPLMQVSDHLTWIAEVVLNEVLALSWRHLVARHGQPQCTSGGRVCDTGFAVIAYGKLGGMELGYGSDLDLVFLHAAEDDDLPTRGKKPLPVAVFFARLAQHITHVMTARTPSGELYEIDLRLRPSGASGLLVSNLDAFEEYQRQEAWTWEHQALVRARYVAGDAAIARRFDAVRRGILGREREPATLRREVVEMRERMRRELGAGKSGRFHLKQDRGGIADIEFMVQYGVLAWAHDCPELLDYTDNIRLLEALARGGRLPEDEAGVLADAYRAYRGRVHRLTLQEQPVVVPASEFRQEREAVGRIWDRLMLAG